MKEHPGCGTVLARLLNHRGLAAHELADRAAVPADELDAVLLGTPPTQTLLRRLAPALGLHTVDLVVLAGHPVPEDLTPLDPEAERWVDGLISDAWRLPAAQRRDLLEQARALPQQDRRSAFAPRRVAPLFDGPGSWPVRMLQYRNLSWSGMARVLAVTTPTYLSASTYGVIGSGRKNLTSRLVTDFAAVLGLDAGELAAVTGVAMRQPPPPPTPATTDTAALLWECRRLSAEQVRGLAQRGR
ncbi:hypothetical protein [Streptacidiphilus jiangxiensis]|uniref:HTH cro/C1-type domain-containing protein n=1 Tax=Streptacidiphilus jiangxiensis TaxID=235985 RepID=A0A1H7YWH0_STRJI|nr:hypothetical protein [Streptacidiphilus jiangxiensis]SEM50184.1 hypothetical protein SAMN05414137_13112 [Streptacidiphilus jiangxiensis]